MPKRIQRKRTKGWRMPTGAVYVGRPTKWGNPVTLNNLTIIDSDGKGGIISPREPTIEDVVDAYLDYICEEVPELMNEARSELRGHDLACWCPLDEPCHADVLLKIANDDG